MAFLIVYFTLIDIQVYCIQYFAVYLYPMMDHILKLILFFSVFLVSSYGYTDDSVIAELDAVWAEMSRTVSQGDIHGYRATFHQDAVLVKGTTRTTYMIDKAFQRWQQDFIDTKAGRRITNVDFRFSKRFHDQNTAHETGMFYYYAIDEAGKREDHYVQLEALLVKKSGKWLMIMEFQKAASSKSEWDLLK